ncbi:MAG: Mo-dependent nitrogenase C-terminal domain-containing protein [Prochlorothrix sp.]|nr:Mo-dependent nitrogenase C-terminal domain-containing protein [Prochlorothrix sp.]
MNLLDASVEYFVMPTWLWLSSHDRPPSPQQFPPSPRRGWDLLAPLRYWIEHLQIHNAAFAHRLCHLIPAQCPFERDIKFFGHLLFHIPPMCKLNPLYDDLMMLRFRALCYLAEECGEDVSCYC